MRNEKIEGDFGSSCVMKFSLPGPDPNRAVYYLPTFYKRVHCPSLTCHHKHHYLSRECSFIFIEKKNHCPVPFRHSIIIYLPFPNLIIIKKKKHQRRQSTNRYSAKRKTLLRRAGIAIEVCQSHSL